MIGSVNIKFKDSKNSTWTKINGDDYRIWDNLTNYYVDQRITPEPLASTIVKYEWNGIIYDIQHLRKIGWSFEFVVDESWVHSIEDIKSCDEIEINDIPNGIYHSFQVDDSDQLDINLERINTEPKFKATLTYYSDKIKINKADAILNTHTLALVLPSGGGTVNYYSDFALIDFENEPESTSIDWSNGEVRDIEKINKSGVRFLMYLDASSTATFLENLNKAETKTINGLSIEEYTVETEQSGEDYVRIIVDCVTDVDSYEYDVSPLNTNKIEFIAGATTTYYTDYDILDVESEPNELKVEFPDGSNRLLQTTDKPGLKFVTFLKHTDVDLFVSKLLEADTTEINDTAVTEITYTLEEISTLYRRIEVTGITVEVINEFDIIIDSTNKIEFIKTSTTTYYTDYDIIEGSRDTERLEIDFSDGTKKTLQTIDKDTLKFVTFLKHTDIDLFISKLKESTNTEINDIAVTEVEYNIEDISLLYRRVEVEGVVSTTVNDFDLAKTIYTMVVTVGVGITYRTNYVINEFTEDDEPVEIEFPDGTNKIGKTVTRRGKTFVTFLNKSESAGLKEDLQRATSILLDSSNVLEKRPLEVEELNVDYDKCTFSGITSVLTTYFNLTPSNTYNLRIIYKGVTTNYYTDFDIELISQEPDRTVLDQNDGTKSDSRVVSFIVQRATFYLDQTDAFNLKQDFETFGTVTLDGTTVLESANINPTKLAPDLYEVLVDCKVEADPKYPLNPLAP
jgi:hypothetical protein